LIALGGREHQTAFGRPGRWLSINPSTPETSNRLRHLSTVAAVTPTSAATRADAAAEAFIAAPDAMHCIAQALRKEV
jgi:hypothetical protein